MGNKKSKHSVTLDVPRCKGCTNCMRRCPTQAIRVHHGKAHIIENLCIDCGECIRRCPYRAKKAKTDELSILKSYKYTIALVEPSLYGQFPTTRSIPQILSGVKAVGFDSVELVADSCLKMTQFTSFLLEENAVNKPAISAACPAIVRLIRLRFPQLCDNVLPIVTPMQVAARKAKEQAMKEMQLSFEDIGCFIISPCPAKVTAIRDPIGLSEQWLDGGFSMSQIYPQLLEGIEQKPLDEFAHIKAHQGTQWAVSGGEAQGLKLTRYLAADGIENVMLVLEDMEDDRLEDLDFIELNACPGGCVGGVLTVDNPYVARARIMSMMDYTEEQKALETLTTVEIQQMFWKKPLTDAKVMRLSEDLETSLVMMTEIEKIHKLLPDLDCGSCGSPTCRTMAEDIVKGKSKLENCVFIANGEDEIS